MEAGLELYAEPYDPQRPRVCFDEAPQPLIEETRQPQLAQPEQAERYDYEYRRNGTCNTFMLFEFEQAWRHVVVTAQRTRVDFAHQMRWLVDVRHPHAQVIRVILDTLNTHCPGALYEAFEPAEARRLLRRLKFHFTPQQASWLNMAELECSVFARQCWDRRLGSVALFQSETPALEDQHSAAHATVHWRFTAHDARVRIQHVDPSASG